MLLLHEVHHMVGKREKAFEAAYQAWMAALGEEEEPGCCGSCTAHGSGPSYQAVTITGARRWRAWSA